jgi:hypothetical protein
MFDFDRSVRFLPAVLSVMLALAVKADDAPSASMMTWPALVMFPPKVTVEQSTLKSPPELIVLADTLVKVPARQTKSIPLVEEIELATFTDPEVEVITADLPPDEPVHD